MRKVYAVLVAVSATVGAGAQGPRVPTFDQIIELKRPGAVAISPDGARVAFTVNETNWEDNAFETEIFLAATAGGAPVQLTRAKKSSSSPSWSPDGRWLAFVSDRSDKRQLYLIRPDGGEARALTSGDEGVGSFEWSPDGRSIALTMTDAKPEAHKERDKKYGEFDVVDQDYRMMESGRRGHRSAVGQIPTDQLPTANWQTVQLPIPNGQTPKAQIDRGWRLGRWPLEIGSYPDLEIGRWPLAVDRAPAFARPSRFC